MSCDQKTLLLKRNQREMNEYWEISTKYNIFYVNIQVTSSFKKKAPLYIEKRFIYHWKTREKKSSA